MKFKTFLILIISICTLNTFAQTEDLSPVSISWNGVEKWTIGSSGIQVISFAGAQYPADNKLPYFNKRITCDKAFSYTAELRNPVYTPLSAAENDVIADSNIPSKEAIQTNILTEKGSNYLDITILPFVSQSGKVVKLKSFDLVIKKTAAPQKVTAGSMRTYASTSILSQGKFVKVKIAESGIYKLTYEDLSSMGVTPANVKVFGYGGAMLDQNFLSTKIDDLPEVAIYMDKGSDGVFNAGDYILFYAQGVTKWSYDRSRLMFTHTINPYSKYGYYFITSDAGIGKRIEDKTITIPDSPTINTVEEFTDYQVHEKELVNLIESGKEFYGETYNDVLSYTFPLSFPNPISSTVRLDVAASSSIASNFTLLLNGGQAKTLSVAKRTEGDNYEQAKAANGTFAFTPTTDNSSYTLTYTKSTSTSVAYLNYLEVNTRRQLKMTGTYMQFQNVDNLGTGTYNEYQLSNAGSNIQIWDITDQQNIFKVPTQTVNGKITFTATADDVHNYLAIDPTVKSAYATPDVDGVVANQNLHAVNQADMVILTNPKFLSQAQTLAQAHREKDNLTVEVFTTDQVYNEFSSGTPDATAYRWAMKMLYDRALTTGNTNDLPKYLLLFGRGCYDNRKITNGSGDNMILTYQAENSLVTTLSYVTDDYFALLDDNEGSQVPSNLLDIGVGRLPVATTDQATNVVTKLVNYMKNENKGNWKNQLCFLADDGDAALHMKQSDSTAVSVGRSFPGFQVNKIYLDAYLQEVTASGESYPLAKNKFMNLIRSGVFLLDYTGHAGATGWANEQILTINDVKTLSNKNLPLFYGATCDFLQFDVQVVSGGEQVVLNPAGGGIGIISAARPVYASQNLTLNKLFCDNLFKKKNDAQQRVGDVLRYAKNNVGTEINKLSYIYMGDPALRLNFPTDYQVMTSKVNESTTFGNDTLRALSVATVQGYIADASGAKVTNFNGTVHAVVYDKVQRITTLNNHQDGSLTYYDRPNTLFSGNAEVKNGVFTIQFMLPKDIKYNYGGGRINYYAADDVNNKEAQGNFENFVVGGTDKNNVAETDGPSVQMYLNSENFVSGDKVNETPLFIANISDTHGVNTVGSGIGHDVTLTVDEDPSQSYVLNDYFVAKENSYSDGTVKYKLPTMANGKHTLTFRVWDLLNNSTTSSTNFEVVTGLTPTIFSVYNYPNPVKSVTSIIVQHDRPETILKTTVEIFDLSGRKVWAFSQASADNISWNLVSNDGVKVKTGVYFYRVSIKTSDSELTSKTNKMFIVEQ